MRQEVVVGRWVVCAVSPGDSSALPESCGEDTPPPPMSSCLFGGFFGRGVWDLPQQGIKPVPPARVTQSETLDCQGSPAHGSERRTPPACGHSL